MRFSGMFVIIIAVFVAVLIVSNIIAIKLIHVFTLPGDFLGEAAVYLPASIIVFPITYLVGNVLTEVYGFRVARGVIWLGFGANLLVVVALWLTGLIPSVFFWDGQDAYDRILGQVPRILLASFTAYLLGEFSNSMTLSILKVRTKGRFLWLRTISSTVVGQGLDSFVFISIAFGSFAALGVSGELTGVEIVRTALIQWAFKIAYEVAATPLTYWVVGQLKAKEKMDAYDAAHSLNPFGVFAMPSDEAAPAKA